MPGPVGNPSRMDVVELLDGYPVSYTYTWGVWAASCSIRSSRCCAWTARGHARKSRARALSIDPPSLYTNRNTWLSPVLRAICLGAQDLFAAKDPLRAKPEPMPAPVLWLAGICCLMSLLGAVWSAAASLSAAWPLGGKSCMG